jgi:hypothetical protein
MNTTRMVLTRALQVSAVLVAGLTVAECLVRFPQYFGYFGNHAVWFGLGVFTAFTFGHVALSFRRSWNVPRFWMILVSLVTFHVLGYIAILERIAVWPLIWFAFIAIVEIPSLGMLFHALGFEFTPRATRATSRSRAKLPSDR